MVLREPGGSPGSQGGGVASHPGAVAGDCGEDCPTYQVWLGKTSSLIHIRLLSGGWAAGYWCHCPSVPPSKPREKDNTRDKSLLFRSLNKCYWIRDFWSLNTKQPNKWYHKLASILDIYYCWLNKKLKRGFFTRRQKVMKSHEIESRGTSWTKYLLDKRKKRWQQFSPPPQHDLRWLPWRGLRGTSIEGEGGRLRELE